MDDDESFERKIRISAKPNAFRLGGKPVLSLDCPLKPSKVPAVCPDIRLTMDWDWAIRTLDWERLARLTRLTSRECALFMAHWRRGTPRYLLGDALGLTPSQVNAAYVRVLAKLKRGGSTAVLASTPSYVEVMAGEKLYLSFSQQDRSKSKKTGHFRGRINRSYMEPLSQLQERFKAESAKLQRLGERAHQANLAREVAERELEQLESSLAREQMEVALAERLWPPASAGKALTAAHALVASAAHALDAQRGAVAKQSDIVTQIESEIGARRSEAFLNELAPARAEMLEEMSRFAAAAGKIEDIAARHGMNQHELGQALFPPTAFDGNYVEGWKRAALINAMLNLRNYLQQSFGKAV